MSVISRKYYSRPEKPKRTNGHAIEINNLSKKFNYKMKDQISLSFLYTKSLNTK